MAFCSSIQRGIISITIFHLLSHHHGRAVDRHRINIPVFFNTDGIYQEFVFDSAVKLFRYKESTRNNESSNDFELEMHFSKADISNLSSRSNGLGSLIPLVSNLTSFSQGAIFVDVTESSILYSTLLESVSIPSIGLFPSQDGVPITQESSAAIGFTRVAASSVVEYAQAMAKIMKKMGWQSLSIVISTTYDGKRFADAMKSIASKEKWVVLSTFWILGDEHFNQIATVVHDIIESKSDVVIAHIRQRSNDEIFRTIQLFQSVQNRSVWLFSDASLYSLRNLSSVPSGVVKIGTKSPEMGQDYQLYINALYDSFVLFENAFKKSFEGLSKGERNQYSPAVKYERLQQKATKHLKEIFFTGESSLFREYSLPDQHGSVFNIWNLKKDLDGRKHWSQVGLITPSGLALEPIMGLNGNTLTPLLHPRRPILRVPVVLSSSLVEAKDPALAENRRTCVGRALPCRARNSTQQGEGLLCCFGASIDFLKFLQRDLGFDTEIYLTPDGQYGKLDPSKGKWTGIVNEIVSGKADLAIDLSVSMQRSKFIDMLYPNVPTALNILVKTENSHGKQARVWFSWLEPFQLDLWIAILVACNVILFVVWWLDRKSPKGYYHILKDSDEDAFTLLDSMSYVWGVAFSKDIGAEKSPRSNSARFVSAVYAFLALVIVNTYCANLMAFLVQESPILPITGIRDDKLTEKSLHPPDGFKLGVERGSNEEAYFKNHVEDEFREIYHVNLKINLLDSFDDGIKQLTAGKLHGFIGNYQSLQQAGNKDPKCRFRLAGPNFYTYGYGFAFPKGSPWIEEAKLSVLKNQENGSIQAIMDYWFNKKDCHTVPVKSLDYDKFVGLFLLIAGVIAFCFMALATEMLVIFLLIKFGRHLGPLGKFLKRMIFSVRKGEENEIHIKWLQLYRQHRSMRPNQAQARTASEVSLRKASFYNLSFEFGGDVLSTNVGDQQTLHLRRWKMLDVAEYPTERSNGEVSVVNGVGKDNNVAPKRLRATSTKLSQV